jgi:very-short-patch-repair endonuclease
MNAVEIEEAVSRLAEAPFDAEEFPFAFLEAFGNKATTLKRLRSEQNSSNQSDVGGVLQRNNIHLKVCGLGDVSATLTALRESSATTKHKAKFILATDGLDFEAENLVDGETIACAYPKFADHFGFFLPLAGITTVKQIRENAFDIKATGRLNRLYVELLKDNPDWDKGDRREDFNHFMARLIFCFFAEDTNIFHGDGLFTQAIARMSDGENTHEVLAELFRAMATPLQEREALGIKSWANVFPYVNGGLFSSHPMDRPHPLAPSPKTGEGGQEESLTPLSPSGRGAGGEGIDSGEYWSIPPALKQKMTEVARQFRKKPTSSENILWQALRGRKLEGRKFKRQQPIGAFIVDFFCGAERLVVEVDGGVHESQQEADRQRQELLESLGLRVVRVSSELVERNLEQALTLVRQGFSPHPLAPSPKEGEGGQEDPLTPLSRSGRGVGGEGVPRFSKIARSYLLHIGNLDWKRINPDIFGSMIQAIADDEERGTLGMHYTSVPNILKVLNPLFLDDLRAQLEAAGDNARKLLNLRQRMAKIRVFDPACGSGNFLVIAYKEMRSLEAEINRRRGEGDRKSEIPLTNFRGIEIRHFAVEVARLALIIAEYQCDVLYRGQMLALAEFLPLKSDNWITCGNALRLDWLSLCPPTGKGVTVQREDLDLWQETLDEAEIDFVNEGGETYICGNPPYVGDKFQTQEQKNDLKDLVVGKKDIKAIDYIVGWFWKASDYIEIVGGAFGFVSTNSICQGIQVPLIWSRIFQKKQEIFYAYRSFYWSNNASNNANVICVIVGVRNIKSGKKYLFDRDLKKDVENINAYLLDSPNVIVEKHSYPINNLPEMVAGNIPRDQANFMLTSEDRGSLLSEFPETESIIRRIQGSKEFINGIQRYCLWIEDDQAKFATSIPLVFDRLQKIRLYREIGSDRGKLGIETPHRFERTITSEKNSIIVPRVSSEHREFLPVGLLTPDIIISDAAQAVYDAPIYVLAILASKMHIVWTSLTAGRMKSDFRYSSGVCYNAFPVPTLTEQNKTDLTRCAEDILLAREHYFPATIADMYDRDRMDSEFPLVREAHERNDEIIERIYIGRRFKNDTERLEKLFEMYSKMTSKQAPTKPSSKRKTKS